MIANYHKLFHQEEILSLSFFFVVAIFDTLRNVCPLDGSRNFANKSLYKKSALQPIESNWLGTR